MLPLERVGKNMSKSEPFGRAHWLIAKHEHSRMDVLTIDLGGEGEALAVFSSEEEAEAFLLLRLGAYEAGWRVRETSAGELTSVLYGPCAGMEKVTLDPVSEVLYEEDIAALVSVDRKDFARMLLGEEPSASLGR
jgi:hypothetical protein